MEFKYSDGDRINVLQCTRDSETDARGWRVYGRRAGGGPERGQGNILATTSSGLSQCEHLGRLVLPALLQGGRPAAGAMGFTQDIEDVRLRHHR